MTIQGKTCVTLDDVVKKLQDLSQNSQKISNKNTKVSITVPLFNLPINSKNNNTIVGGMQNNQSCESVSLAFQKGHIDALVSWMEKYKSSKFEIASMLTVLGTLNRDLNKTMQNAPEIQQVKVTLNNLQKKQGFNLESDKSISKQIIIRTIGVGNDEHVHPQDKKYLEILQTIHDDAIGYGFHFYPDGSIYIFIRIADQSGDGSVYYYKDENVFVDEDGENVQNNTNEKLMTLYKTHITTLNEAYKMYTSIVKKPQPKQQEGGANALKDTQVCKWLCDKFTKEDLLNMAKLKTANSMKKRDIAMKIVDQMKKTTTT